MVRLSFNLIFNNLFDIRNFDQQEKVMLKSILSALFGLITFQCADSPTELILPKPIESIPEPTQSPPLPTPSARKLDLGRNIIAATIFQKIIEAKDNCKVLYVYQDTEDNLVFECDSYYKLNGDSQEPLDSFQLPN